MIYGSLFCTNCPTGTTASTTICKHNQDFIILYIYKGEYVNDVVWCVSVCMLSLTSWSAGIQTYVEVVQKTECVLLQWSLQSNWF